MAAPLERTQLEGLLEAMLASALDAVVTMDRNGRILMFNAAAEAIFGHAARDAVGREVSELIIPPALRARHRQALARHLSTGSTTIMNRRVEVAGLRADGTVFPLELTVTRVPVEGPPTFTAYLRDITDRKRDEEALRDSRARAVESADRERRRIERNLHDGAQQRLVAIALLLRRVEMTGPLPPQLEELVQLAQDEAGRAIEELRELARGIHPAALTESGLPTALRGLALRAPVDVAVDVDDEAALPESSEIALYYVAAEALANVAKYAAASQATLTLELDTNNAVLRIADDGVGGADVDGGSGLAGLAERVEALGGRLSVDSPPGGGTVVAAFVPRG
jgi:PAS domain S-box-containing protein